MLRGPLVIPLKYYMNLCILQLSLVISSVALCVPFFFVFYFMYSFPSSLANLLDLGSKATYSTTSEHALRINISFPSEEILDVSASTVKHVS